MLVEEVIVTPVTSETMLPRVPAMRVPLSRIAHTRSGDKGDTRNIGVIASDKLCYPVLVHNVTAARAPGSISATC